MRVKSIILAAVFFVFGNLFSGPALTADYPSKPLEIICPFSAGSDTDVAARLVADVGSKYFGQAVVVIDKTGASGTIAAADVIASNPDGYKALWGAHSYFATTYRTQKVPFNVKDLVPIANFYELKQGLAVRGDSPFKTWDDLRDYAKKHPGDLSWSHTGRGIALHMSATVMFRKSGLSTIDLPYKGSPEASSALLGGHVQAASLPLGTVLEQVKAGKIRFLTFYTDKRYDDQPNVPAVTELGFPEAALPTYWAIYVRKDTPESIKKALTALSKKIVEDPRFKRDIEKLGGQPRYGGPEFVMAAIKKQEEVGIPILKEVGLYVGD